jgi:hypothetical protein
MPAKLSFRNEDEIKSLKIKPKLKGFIITRLTLQETHKGMLN